MSRLTVIRYYIMKAVQHHELNGHQARYLWNHPRVARKWIQRDLGLRI